MRAMCAGCAVIVLAGISLLSGRANAADDSALAFYRGKQVRFFTMGSPGGGYDAYTRMVSTFLGRKLDARVLPTNETAAGGLIAMNRTMNAAPDGLTLLLTGGEALVTAQLYGLPGVNYDVRRQVWLARVSGEDKVVVLGAPSPYQSVSEMQKADKPVLWAGSGKADTNSDLTALMCYVLGVRCKIIVGYKGTGDMNIAIQRGEVDGRVISDESAALYAAGAGMRVLATLARKRSDLFPQVPTIFEAADLNAEQKRLIDWRASIAALGRVILVTPGTPQDRVDLLQKMLGEILTDAAFVAEAKKQNLSAGYVGAEQVRATVQSAMATLDEKGLSQVKEIVLERYYQN
jgi:tripartite-type tricarboxylate transporter receptor subunit TctC